MIFTAWAFPTHWNNGGCEVELQEVVRKAGYMVTALTISVRTDCYEVFSRLKLLLAETTGQVAIFFQQAL